MSKTFTRRSALGFGVLSLLGLPGSLRAAFFPDPPAVTAMADPPPVVQDPPPVRLPLRTETRMVTTYRRPLSHTHTCSAGHTWDHASNPGHTCQICGRQQYVQDSPSRMVAVVTRQTVEVPVTPAWVPSQPPPPIPPTATTVREVQRIFRVSASGCATGNCPLVR